MEKRKLGELEVSALGLGCMGMSASYDRSGLSENDSIELIRKAISLGITFFDTAEVYGPFTNENLLGRALKNGYRDKVVIATKFGFKFVNGQRAGLDSSPRNIKAAAEASLSRLKIDVIDLYYQHRVDPAIPIEETVGAMSELVKEGKVRYLGLSEAGVKTIRRANAVHQITALQSEYSLWERNLEESIIPLLKELGIGLVPFCPLGRGFLGGKFESTAEIAAGDMRLTDPRFHEENFYANKKVVEKIRAIGTKYGATPAQIALAWCLSRSSNIVPIPGTTKIERLKENCKSTEIVLMNQDKIALDELISQKIGARYNEENMAFVDR